MYQFISQVSAPFHPFGGAVDIIVVQQPDGTYKSSAWYVKFGKFQGVLKAKERIVTISVNDVQAGFHMYLDHKGEAFFLREVDDEVIGSGVGVFSPPTSGDDTDGGSSKKYEYGNGEITTVRSSSRRSRIMGLVFGTKSRKEEIQGVGVERTSSLESAEIAADLYDVKWSTNLPTSNVTVEEPDIGSQFKEDQGLANLVALENNFSKDVTATDLSERFEIHFDETYMLGTSVLDDTLETPPEISSNVCETEVAEPEVSSQLACAVTLDKDSPDDLNLSSDENFDKLHISSETFRYEETSLVVSARNGVMESHYTQLATSKSCESEELEVVCRKTTGKTPTEERILETAIDIFQSRSLKNDASDPSITGSIKRSLEEPFKVSGSCEHIGSDNLVHSLEEDSHVDCISSSHGSSDSLHQEENFLRGQNDNGLHSLLHIVDDHRKSSIENLFKRTTHSDGLPFNVSEEDQLLFGEIDDFKSNKGQHKSSDFTESLDIGNDPLVHMDNIKDLNESVILDHSPHLSPVVLSKERSPNTYEVLSEETTAKSSPMTIPGSRIFATEEVELKAESLPIFPSRIDSLETAHVLHPLSHSLDSHSEELRQELLQKDVLNFSISELGTKNQCKEDDRTIKDTDIWEELKTLSTKNIVEISLCKHLIYEGMGLESASQAFEAEKVDLNNYSSLGTELMKNENLIVRIGGRYFPWAAAASYMLEIVALGHDQIFEPEGMIDVGQVKKGVDGEPSSIDIPSGGNWRLWPFGRRRSTTMNPVQPVLDGTHDSISVNAFESLSDTSGSKTVPVDKIAKKKVKSIVPTSEQLQTLNLKDGRNVVTFTFSTEMLGKQQVDARIYLWKWNARIVVSDVDGTITRSDVLGQFMPLVGKDWSHIGVTHLFSAIKENGYQLLFLSARAISQAHLTRQFLFNLKQDGKALPDGPVVISPDGLFPSLFREVIRRAPHEFKISCLQDIRACFPPDSSPFYAGFGNRITDEISYLKLGISKGKIFTINARGEVAVNRRFDRKSYTSLHALVDSMFPPTSSVEQEDFNDLNYWRMRLMVIN